MFRVKLAPGATDPTGLLSPAEYEELITSAG
jgi:hypothetical protein